MEAAGFERPTPIQSLAIPPALNGRDILGRAPTGTGKTAAFVLPIAERLGRAKAASRVGLRVLVLAPTRELAMQIHEAVEQLGSPMGLASVVLVGGIPLRQDRTALAKHPNMVVATPGRLIDHLEHRAVDLSRVAILVLDEADRMLDLGFMPQVSRILRALPEHRQTMLFSATIPQEIDALAKRHLRDPVRVEVGPSRAAAPNADQRVMFISREDKEPCLLALLRDEPGTVLVFVATKREADSLHGKVKRAGFAVAALHGDLEQRQRLRALEAFKQADARILIATDVAGRGLDVEGIAHVVNFDVPIRADDYIHRVGRTARADASGRATTLVAYDELDALTAIERHLQQSIPQHAPPEGIVSPPWAHTRRGHSKVALAHEGMFAPAGFRVRRRR